MNKSEVSAAGFAAIKRAPRRLVANIQGFTKAGKTRLALTARKPLGYICLEIGGDEGVADYFIEQGMDSSEAIQIARVRMADIVYPNSGDFQDDRKYQDALTAAVHVAANKGLDDFYAAYYASLANFATTVVDTASDLYDIVRLANFGRLERVPQVAYAQVNKQMDKIIDDAFSAPGSTLFLHHMADKGETFTNDKGKEQWRPSGNYDLAGYKGMKKKVQATIELWREDLEKEDDVTGQLVKFHSSIVESRHNAGAIGKTFEYDFTFQDIGLAVISGSQRQDWE